MAVQYKHKNYFVIQYWLCGCWLDYEKRKRKRVSTCNTIYEIMYASSEYFCARTDPALDQRNSVWDLRASMSSLVFHIVRFFRPTRGISRIVLRGNAASELSAAITMTETRKKSKTKTLNYPASESSSWHGF